ncbi:MAG: TonB-dependent receptor [Pseudomonadota bacterium]
MLRTLLQTTALTLLSLAPGLAQAQNIQPINIPSQGLAAAIAEFGEETGVQIGISDDLAAGKRSTAVQGPMEPMAALTRLLAGTGLAIQTVGTTGAVVTRGLVSQDASDDSVFDLGTLILRGELIDRDIQESQTSAVVIPGEELEERGETDLRQTLRRVPGVHEGNQIVIRGISADSGLGNLTSTSTVNIAVDGIRLSDYRNTRRDQLSTWDMEQIEVLRGPQSTQSGRNALAGSITLQSAKPEFFSEYKGRVGVGNFDSYQAALVLNTPLIEDRLAFRLSVDRRESDGFGDTIDGTNDRVGFEDLLTVRAGLRFDPTDRLSFNLTYTDIDDAFGSTGTTTDAFPDRVSADGTRSQLDLRSLGLSADYRVSDSLTLSSRTLYTEAQPNLNLPFPGGFLLRDREYETFEQEFTLSYTTETLRAVAGIFYTNIEEDSLTFGEQTGLGSASSDEQITTENYAFYGEVEYDLDPSWTVIAGLRYDVEDVENTSSADQALEGLGVVASSSGTSDNTYTAFLPKLGVVYRFSEDMSLGFTYQRGYRAGGTGITINATTAPNPYTYDPEFTDTFELAFRSQSSDGSRILNANLFYTSWTDQQVSQERAPGDFVITNAGESEVWGAEIDYRQFVTDALEVFASAAYAETEYKDFVSGGEQLAGNEFPFAPKLKASLGAYYTFANGLGIGGDVTYTSKSFSNPQNTDDLENEAFWVTNLSANYAFENGAVLTGYVRNLFDEDYTTTLNRPLGTPGGFASIGAPREIGAFLSYTF